MRKQLAQELDSKENTSRGRKLVPSHLMADAALSENASGDASSTRVCENSRLGDLALHIRRETQTNYLEIFFSLL
jgi:hypothetical protein